MIFSRKFLISVVSMLMSSCVGGLLATMYPRKNPEKNRIIESTIFYVNSLSG